MRRKHVGQRVAKFPARVRTFLPAGGVAAWDDPEADFTADETAPDTDTAVAFSYTGGGGVASYLWDFGDGDTSTSAAPSHTYTDAGIYTVSLTVVLTAGGTKRMRKVGYITVSVLALWDDGDDLVWDDGSPILWA